MINKSKVFFLFFILVLSLLLVFWYVQDDSYSYLFEEKGGSMASNIVGQFGYGAFGWYLPSWLVDNWDMEKFGEQGMVFKPKIRSNNEDFSDIVLDVSTSTELNNSEYIFHTKQRNLPKSRIIINEIVLNKHTQDVLSIAMEANTRIYHLVMYTRDFRRITDMYFMDGNSKTLQVTFETKSEIFSQFSDKIRNLVEGIGELKPPQG